MPRRASAYRAGDSTDSWVRRAGWHQAEMPRLAGCPLRDAMLLHGLRDAESQSERGFDRELAS